jgi:hypothetical protein
MIVKDYHEEEAIDIDKVLDKDGDLGITFFLDDGEDEQTKWIPRKNVIALRDHLNLVLGANRTMTPPTPYGAYALCALGGFFIAILVESILPGAMQKLVQTIEPLPKSTVFDPIEYTEKQLIASGTGEPKAMLSCQKCLHRSGMPLEAYPCSNCYDHSQWEAIEEPKSCSTCNYECDSLDPDEGSPCCFCLGMKKWEPKK